MRREASEAKGCGLVLGFFLVLAGSILVGLHFGCGMLAGGAVCILGAIAMIYGSSID